MDAAAAGPRVKRIEVHRKIIRANGSIEEKGLSAVWDDDPAVMEADIAAIGDPNGKGRVTPSPQMLAMSPEEMAAVFGVENVEAPGINAGAHGGTSSTIDFRRLS